MNQSTYHSDFLALLQTQIVYQSQASSQLLADSLKRQDGIKKLKLAFTDIIRFLSPLRKKKYLPVISLITSYPKSQLFALRTDVRRFRRHH
jgi:hypothetical protein